MRLTIEYFEGDTPYMVTVDYDPGTPDVYHLSNGDPGYPGDPEEVEVVEARLDGRVVPHETFDLDRLLEQAREAYREHPREGHGDWLFRLMWL